MVGQGYDGTALISSRFNGVQAHARKLNDINYVHCKSRSINLAISDACVLQSIRSCISVLRTV